MNQRRKLPGPQGLKPACLAVRSGTAESRALPKTIYEMASDCSLIAYFYEDMVSSL